MATYTEKCTAKGGFSYAGNFTLYITLDEVEIDTNNNRSKIQYHVYCQSSGSGSINSEHVKWFRLNGIDITNVSVQVNVASPNAYIEVAKGTTGYITHNSDGTMSVSFGASIEGKTYGVVASKSGTFTMSTIPRASSISCTTANIGETATIIISSAVSTWTHKVWATFDKTDSILQDVKGGTYAWTIPESYYEKIPNSKSGTGELFMETWNGNNLVGNTKINFTITTNEEKCKPTITATVVDTNNTTINLTGSSTKLVKHKSTAKITINATAKNSATIKSKSVNNTNVSGTTLSISNITTNSFTVTATDSRGYSNSVTLRPTMINYIPLSINANAKRLNSTSSQVLLDFTGNYFNGNFGSVNNTLTMTWKYKKKNESTYSSTSRITPAISGSVYSNGTSSINLGELFNYQDLYNIQIIATDKLSTVNITLEITAGTPVFNNGKDFFNINGRFLINGVEYGLEDLTSKVKAVKGNILGGKVFKMGRIAFWQIAYKSTEESTWGEMLTFSEELEPLPSNDNCIYIQGQNVTLYDKNATTPLQVRSVKNKTDTVFLTFSYITKN